MVATSSRAVPPPEKTIAGSVNPTNNKKDRSISSRKKASSPRHATALIINPIAASSKKATASFPQIVENTLKDFYEYLKMVKETLQLQQQQEQQQIRKQQQLQQQQQQQQQQANNDDDKRDDDTIGTCGDYSWYKQKPTAVMNDGSGRDQTANGLSSDNNELNSPTTATTKTYWGDRDTHQYLQRLEKFKTLIVVQIDRFPLQSQAGREIMDAIQSAASRGAASLLRYNGNTSSNNGNNHRSTMTAATSSVLRHASQMAIYVSKLLQEIQLVDLDKLIDLMKHNQQAGHDMANKDVILLCGAARSGKTTTLHYLAGSKLEEVEVEGFFHLQPTRVKHAALANFKTACSDRDPVTDHLQTAAIQIGQKEVVLCDTPGLGNDASLSSCSVELDIANGLGMIRALHRAKTIKPVFVLSRDEVRIRERFSAFDGETVACISRLLGKSQELDLGPLNYVFTKYEGKHRECLCRQFIAMRKNNDTLNGNLPKTDTTNKDDDNDEEQDLIHNQLDDPDVKLMRTVLDDIVKKTTPQANIVMPLEENHVDFVKHLWDTSRTIQDPTKFFVPFVSFAALKKLQLQLRITLSDLRTSLVEEDHTTAVYRLQQLQQLASVLPEAKDCANLGEEAVRKQMLAIQERVMASIERKDTSMAIHRAQQIVTLAEVLPDTAKAYGTVTYDAVVMLRELNQALKSNDYKICHGCLTKLIELAREFPESQKCAHFAIKVSIQHVSEFREEVAKLLDIILEESKEVKHFITYVEKLQAEIANAARCEPLLLLCVNAQLKGLDKKDVRAMSKLAQSSSDAFCIHQVQRLTDHLKRDIPEFRAENIDLDDLLSKKDTFLASIERLKIVSLQLRESPAGARAESIYHLAFQDFHDFVSAIIKESEGNYKSSWTDLDVFGRKLWFVALLLQGPLKNKPHTARKEHSKIEDLERRVLKLMLRLEIEVTRSMDQLKNFKFPACQNTATMKPDAAGAVPDFGIGEMKAPRFLLIAVAKNARIRKMLPTKLDVLEINVCIAMFDHALLNFWKKVVIRLEQDYAVIVAMQKVNHKDPDEILQIAKLLQTDIMRVEKEFLGVCGWSDDITTESESDLKRLIAVRDCVQSGVVKLEETANARVRGSGMRLFACGGLDSVSDSNFMCSTPNLNSE